MRRPVLGDGDCHDRCAATSIEALVPVESARLSLVAGEDATFELSQVLGDQRTSGRAYWEFLRTKAFSVGLYVLAAGATDEQSPHTEDEIYYVVGGRAQVTVGDTTSAVQPGSIVRAGPGVPHRFHDIAEKLQLLVFFAPPEGTAGGG